MLRPVLAFLTLTVAAFVLMPTVTSVGKGVEDLNIVRELPWSLWEWGEQPPPDDLLPPDCDWKRRDMESEVTKWPARITKNESFDLGGYVRRVDTKEGRAELDVTLYLNETKTEPGILLGTAVTRSDGTFTLETRIPHDLDATKYHLVAHSKEKRVGCEVLKESWSDPEMDVTAKTRFAFDLPDRVVVGTNLSVQGRLLDEVGAPVRRANFTLEVDGKRLDLRTDAAGRFNHTFLVERTQPIVILASYEGTKHYGASNAQARVRVVPEDVVLQEPRLVRSREAQLGGRVFLSPDAEKGNLTLRFEGIHVAACATCKAGENLTVSPGADGSFAATVFVPPGAKPGPFRVAVTGGGLKETHAFNGTLLIPVTLTVEAAGDGFLSRAYSGTVTLVNDAGAPVAGEVVFVGPDEAYAGPTDAQGVFTLQGKAGCGFHDAQAVYAGDATHLGAIVPHRMGVCGPLAYLPPWVLGTPGWVWAVTAVLAVATLVTAARLRTRYAPTIRRGPPLTLRITEPHDLAPDVLSPGETVRVTAFLEDPLPAGHVLRMGTHRHMDTKRVADDLRASHDLVPEKMGHLALRAEILDERGRIVTRRTVHLHVVQYAAEVERRYRALKSQRAGDEADVVTPREFETWLRERAPDLDPSITRRLVGLFEEADYGPRETAREEFLAYLEAEKGLGVARRAA